MRYRESASEVQLRARRGERHECIHHKNELFCLGRSFADHPLEIVLSIGSGSGVDTACRSMDEEVDRATRGAKGSLFHGASSSSCDIELDGYSTTGGI